LVRQTRPKSANAAVRSGGGGGGGGGGGAAAGVDMFREVREAARRINVLSLKSGTTFTSAPKSYDLSKKLSDNRRARTAADPIHAFHAKQLSNMQRRISEQGSATERKKNTMDVRAYPALLRKQSNRKPAWGFGGSMSHAAVPSTSASSTPAATPRPTSARGPNRDLSAAHAARGYGGFDGGGGAGDHALGRPQSAGPEPGVRRRERPGERVPGAEYMRPTRADVKDHPAYQTLRKKLLHEIVRQDASEEDMGRIFDDAQREHSGSQHRHVIAQVIADLRVELELQIGGG